MSNPIVKISVDENPGAGIPALATPGSAGYDLCASLHLVLPAGEFRKVNTGIRIEMPSDIEAQVRPRSGLAARHGVTVLNSPGTIDSDYRGEVCVILINHGSKDFVIEPGMRIAQLVFSRVTHVCFEKNEMLADSLRGEGGFGSTGISAEGEKN